MNTIHTILREDFGELDRDLVRSELLAERGICGVSFEATRNHVCVDYDPALVDATKLMDILCRCGVYPMPCTSTSELVAGDG